ncbi:unnamed protein product [Periconia digitata]|uniref:Rhodopsin domain-containing protein n=1 Tax=Periconia digitata TaxID=1303443 RepID=A0A9W4UCH3_9PLEO|nr:unnamed protein product [Periconia digitata]
MFAQQATESKSSETLSNTLLGITWTLFGIATISFGARLYLRWKRFGRLFWDDLFVFLAWVFCVLLGVQVVLSLRSADQKTTTANKHDSLFISRPIVQLCFYSSVWSIKVSFLLFFRRLIGVVLRRVRIYWVITRSLNMVIMDRVADFCYGTVCLSSSLPAFC